MSEHTTADRWLMIVVMVAAVAYLAMTPRIFERLNPITGDEPFYVMTAFSLIRDGDLDESNNYAQRDYDEIFPSQPLQDDWQGWTRIAPTISPHEAVTDRDGQYTKHGLGLPLLIAAPYELYERNGAVVVIVLAAIALAGQIYLLARDATARPRLAAIVTFALALVMPIVPYTHLLFPEIPAALLLIYAIRRLASPTNTSLQWLLTGLSVGYLPWLHQRFAPTAFILALIIVVRFWRQRWSPHPLAALIPILIAGVSLIGFNFWLFGAPIMPSENHDGFNSPAGTVNGAVGILFDAQWGLMIAAPLMLLAVAAIPWWVAVDRDVARVTALAVVPYLLLLAVYSVWWGAWGPPARYLVPVVPLAAGPLAAWLSRAAWPGWVAAVGLWLVGATLTLIGLFDPHRFYHQPTGHNNLIEAIDGTVGTDIADRLVAFQTLGPSPLSDRVLAGALGVGLLVIATLAVSVLPRRRMGDATVALKRSTRSSVRLMADQSAESRTGK